MIFSALKMFSDAQSIPLANDTASHDIVSTNAIDLGKPGRGFRLNQDFKRDIGTGNNVPMMANVNSVSGGVVATIQYLFQTSADNTTWTTLASSETVAASVGTGCTLSRVPQGTRRYVRMVYRIKATSAPGASKTVTVTSAIGTEQNSKVSNI